MDLNSKLKKKLLYGKKGQVYSSTGKLISNGKFIPKGIRYTYPTKEDRIKYGVGNGRPMPGLVNYLRSLLRSIIIYVALY
jgi:hypothetical protein